MIHSTLLRTYLLITIDYFYVAQTTVLIGVNPWPLPLIIYY